MEIAYRRTMQTKAYESISLEVKLNEDEVKPEYEESIKELIAKVDSICEKHVNELQHAGEASVPDF
jgi:hypothetical protein